MLMVVPHKCIYITLFPDLLTGLIDTPSWTYEHEIKVVLGALHKRGISEIQPQGGEEWPLPHRAPFQLTSLSVVDIRGCGRN